MGEKKTKFISLSKAAKEIGRTSEYLNFLVRQGKFKAEKLGRNWYTQREWIDEFLAILNTPKNKPVKKKQSRKKDFSGSLKVVLIKQPASLEEKNLQTDPLTTLGTKTFWPQLITKISFLLVFFVVFFSGLSFASWFLQKKEFSPERFSWDITEDTFLRQNEKGIAEPQKGKVKGEEATGATSAIATSENFRLKEFSFGGIVLASANEENLPLEITDFKTKVFLSKDGSESQALISWRTNKLAISEIQYAKINSLAEKKLQEENYAFNHSVILTNLDLGSTYTLTVQAQDRWTNKQTSDKFSIYTGAKAVSVFDLIVKEMNAVFGWAMKK